MRTLVVDLLDGTNGGITDTEDKKNHKKGEGEGQQERWMRT